MGGRGWAFLGLNFPGAWVQLPVLGCLFLGLPLASRLILASNYNLSQGEGGLFFFSYEFLILESESRMMLSYRSRCGRICASAHAWESNPKLSGRTDV